MLIAARGVRTPRDPNPLLPDHVQGRGFSHRTLLVSPWRGGSEYPPIVQREQPSHAARMEKKMSADSNDTELFDGDPCFAINSAGRDSQRGTSLSQTIEPFDR